LNAVEESSGIKNFHSGTEPACELKIRRPPGLWVRFPIAAVIELIHNDYGIPSIHPSTSAVLRSDGCSSGVKNCISVPFASSRRIHSAGREFVLRLRISDSTERDRPPRSQKSAVAHPIRRTAKNVPARRDTAEDIVTMGVRSAWTSRPIPEHQSGTPTWLFLLSIP
jgi:hypothetical protein